MRNAKPNRRIEGQAAWVRTTTIAATSPTSPTATPAVAVGNPRPIQRRRATRRRSASPLGIRVFPSAGTPRASLGTGGDGRPIKGHRPEGRLVERHQRGGQGRVV